MYTKILVPLDGSETAESVLPAVRYLAAALDIPVQLLRVIETLGSTAPMEADQSRYLKALIEDGKRTGQAYLADSAEKPPCENFVLS